MQSIAPHLLLLLGVLVIGTHSQDVVGEDGVAEQGSGREKRKWYFLCSEIHSAHK